MTAMLDDTDLMARLLLSVGTKTHGNRPMTPVEVARTMREFADETGDTLEGMAERLNVHPDTCRMFLAILDLPEDWWEMLHFGQADPGGRLPFSMASKLGPKFKSNNLTKDDLDLLKGAALDPERPARRDDITNILAYRARNPEKTLAQCIEAIMNLTPQRITSHVIITDIDPELLAKLAPPGSVPKDRVRAVLAKNFPDGAVEDLRVKDGKYLQILLNKKGYKRFYVLAKKHGLPAKHLVNHLCLQEVHA